MSQKPIHERLHALAEDATQEVVASRRPWYAVGKVARILFGLYALFLVLFGALAWWVHSSPVLPLDVTITRTLQQDRAPWFQAVMLAVSFLGSAWVLWLLILLAAVLFWMAGLRLETICIVLLSVVSKGLNVVLKVLVARPRPTTHLVGVFQVATGQSFPSEHVMAYPAFWGALPHLKSASDHLTGIAFSSIKRERKGRPGRVRGGHHVMQQGEFELMVEADFR